MVGLEVQILVCMGLISENIGRECAVWMVLDV